MKSNKKIRSISISEHIDVKIKKDSEHRGLTISANIARILHEYFEGEKVDRSGLILPSEDIKLK
tara:strand:+ start:183 stop:374 length:192 start_codon:yes stop_codon:yes gene_type:complete